MKKKYLFFIAFIFFCKSYSQILNQSAAWPNSNWTVTGNYNTAALAFEANPTVTSNFAFDDDDAGNNHEDNIAAVSPVIDLTAAHAAGETFIEVTVNYGFRRNQAALTDALRVEYWNADTSTWIPWGANIPDNYFPLTAIVDNFCTLPKSVFTTDGLNIATFTATQLSGFKYRIFYDDNPAGLGWQWGFCFESPTIQSSAVAPVINCDAALTAPVDGSDEASLAGVLQWSAATGSVSGYKLSVGTTAGGTDVLDQFDVGNVVTYDIPGSLIPETMYYVKIVPYNINQSATGCTEYSFTTKEALVGDVCSNAIDLTDETSPLSSTTVGANNDNVNTCVFAGPITTNAYPDLYYYISVPNGSTLKIGQTVNDYDSTNVVFYGDCTNRTSIACFDDDDYATVVWANNTGAVQDVYWVQDGHSGSGTFTLAWSVVACTNPAATFAVVSLCDEDTEGFEVHANVTSLGSATSVTVSDDQGNSETITAPGVVVLGPYSLGNPVTTTVSNDDDSDCNMVSAVLNQTVCPPTNDTCITAIDLTDETSPLQSTTVGATNDNLMVCNGSGESIANVYPDTYYSILVPNGSTLAIGQTENAYDSANIVFYGDCSNRTNIDCFDDSDTKTVVWNNDTGADKTVYWLQDGWSGSGTFTLAWSVIACTQATVNFAVNSLCSSGEDEFEVITNITSLGSATSLTVSDDQGNSEPVTVTGPVVLGPYSNATPVVITVTNDQDSDCSIVSGILNQTVCPPVNDNLADATSITCGNVYTGSTALATLDEDGAPDGGGADLDGKNVWFSYTGSGTPETVTLDLCGSDYDTSVLVYTGTSGNLTFVAANDDGYACGDTALDTRSFLNFDSNGTTTYYITVEGWNFASAGNYSMDVSCAAVIPPAVPNQTCALAVSIPTDGSSTSSDNSYGTVNPVQPLCDTFGSIQDVWFSFVAPTSGSVECTIDNASLTMTSVNFNIYSGPCDALVPVEGTCNSNLPTGGSEAVTGLIAGDVYFIQVWSSASEQGTFSVAVTDEQLQVETPEINDFKAYPNPVKDILNLSGVYNISKIEVFNLLGQQVISNEINTNNHSLDMQSLPSGAYIVKIASNGKNQTLKIIKE